MRETNCPLSGGDQVNRFDAKCPPMLAFFEGVDGGRERWSRRYWRRECDWDPTFSEFGATNPHRGAR